MAHVDVFERGGFVTLTIMNLRMLRCCKSCARFDTS